MTVTKRVSGAAADGATKRVSGTATQDVTLRVSGAVSQGSTKRFDISELNATVDAWGGSWALTWDTSWIRRLSFALPDQTKRVSGQPSASATKRVG